ncbi:MAG: hypothetical protein IT561_14025 [Alphaproteobacteria bacterium]|nr:hypothetical protein [Alphaproteobacteria bacterium]
MAEEAITGARIDEYARSMFAFDRPHDRWIGSCARYLEEIFGDRLKDGVFLDYAFGRGNWSLAALRCGARQAIAVDASESNVRALDAYRREHAIDRLTIVHGDVVSGTVEAAADILWIYGILPCIAAPQPFLARLAALRRSDHAVALLYAYDAGSLRQAIVSAARQGCVYRTEAAFAADSFLFTPRARLRARDDLTAPLVTWFTQDGLARMASESGYVVRRTAPGFGQWATGSESGELSPHHLVCAFHGAAAHLVPEPPRAERWDVAIVADLARAALAAAPAELRRSIAIGLLNTHFSPPEPTLASMLVHDFLFLMHALVRLGVRSDALEAAREVHAAGLTAVRGRPRSLSPALLDRSVIARHVQGQPVRL